VYASSLVYTLVILWVVQVRLVYMGDAICTDSLIWTDGPARQAP